MLSLKFFVLNNLIQPGKGLSKFFHKKLVPRPGAWTEDGYHVSKDYLPAYEEALVDYILGNFRDCNLQKFGTIVEKKKFYFS